MIRQAIRGLVQRTGLDAWCEGMLWAFNDGEMMKKSTALPSSMTQFCLDDGSAVLRFLLAQGTARNVHSVESCSRTP